MSIWCANHSHSIPDIPRCPQCEIDALRARVAELECYRINSAKFVSDVITENDFYREQLRRIASETHTRLYMQDIAREALNR